MKSILSKYKIPLLAIVALMVFMGSLLVTTVKKLIGPPPAPLVQVNTEEIRHLSAQYATVWEKQLHETVGSPRMTPATVRLSDRALISVNHPWTTTRVINAAVTMASQVQRRLIADDAVVDFDVLFPNDPDPEHGIAFFLDPRWNRIVYCLNSENWIKAYGELHTQPRNEFYLGQAGGLTVDISPRNAVYVADTENGRSRALSHFLCMM
jgi:hypothetical protein